MADAWDKYLESDARVQASRRGRPPVTPTRGPPAALSAPLAPSAPDDGRTMFVSHADAPPSMARRPYPVDDPCPPGGIFISPPRGAPRDSLSTMGPGGQYANTSHVPLASRADRASLHPDSSVWNGSMRDGSGAPGYGPMEAVGGRLGLEGVSDSPHRRYSAAVPRPGAAPYRSAMSALLGTPDGTDAGSGYIDGTLDGGGAVGGEGGGYDGSYSGGRGGRAVRMPLESLLTAVRRNRLNAGDVDALIDWASLGPDELSSDEIRVTCRALQTLLAPPDAGALRAVFVGRDGVRVIARVLDEWRLTDRDAQMSARSGSTRRGGYVCTAAADLLATIWARPVDRETNLGHVRRPAGDGADPAGGLSPLEEAAAARRAGGAARCGHAAALAFSRIVQRLDDFVGKKDEAAFQKNPPRADLDAVAALLRALLAGTAGSPEGARLVAVADGAPLVAQCLLIQHVEGDAADRALLWEVVAALSSQACNRLAFANTELAVLMYTDLEVYQTNPIIVASVCRAIAAVCIQSRSGGRASSALAESIVVSSTLSAVCTLVPEYRDDEYTIPAVLRAIAAVVTACPGARRILDTEEVMEHALRCLETHIGSTDVAVAVGRMIAAFCRNYSDSMDTTSLGSRRHVDDEDEEPVDPLSRDCAGIIRQLDGIGLLMDIVKAYVPKLEDPRNQMADDPVVKEQVQALEWITNAMVGLKADPINEQIIAEMGGIPWVLRAVSALDRAYSGKRARTSTQLETSTATTPWTSPLTSTLPSQHVKGSDVLGSVSQKRSMVAAALEEYKRRR